MVVHWYCSSNDEAKRLMVTMKSTTTAAIRNKPEVNEPLRVGIYRLVIKAQPGTSCRSEDFFFSRNVISWRGGGGKAPPPPSSFVPNIGSPATVPCRQNITNIETQGAIISQCRLLS